MSGDHDEGRKPSRIETPAWWTAEDETGIEVPPGFVGITVGPRVSVTWRDSRKTRQISGGVGITDNEIRVRPKRRGISYADELRAALSFGGPTDIVVCPRRSGRPREPVDQAVIDVLALVERGCRMRAACRKVAEAELPHDSDESRLDRLRRRDAVAARTEELRASARWARDRRRDQ